ncbi:hypothetical protein GCM10010404_75960 [Nonomuraea africana]|uniref:Exo-alpha-sialidase n=1 Tax=Nonomuraea africana TaxID=46171 RepID=A0ABR9KPQ5_9ACTN|nr:sialidase family protein [Nonomuraea africana]MBE1564008.1 hypothetical protein [Nonomuraea africana]
MSNRLGLVPAVQVSHDDGRTWSAPKNLTSVIKAPAGGHDWFATGPGHGIQLTRGPYAGRLVPVHFAIASRQSVAGPTDATGRGP